MLSILGSQHMLKLFEGFDIFSHCNLTNQEKLPNERTEANQVMYRRKQISNKESNQEYRIK